MGPGPGQDYSLLLKLPTEVLYIICAFCSPDGTASAAGTCRQLRNICTAQLDADKALSDKWHGVLLSDEISILRECILPIQLLIKLIEEPHLQYFVRTLEWRNPFSLDPRELDKIDPDLYDQIPQRERDIIIHGGPVNCPGIGECSISEAIKHMVRKQPEVQGCGNRYFDFSRHENVIGWILTLLTNLRTIKTTDVWITSIHLKSLFPHLQKYRGPYGTMLGRLDSIQISCPGLYRDRYASVALSADIVELFMGVQGLRKISVNALVSDPEDFVYPEARRLRSGSTDLERSSVQHLELSLSVVAPHHLRYLVAPMTCLRTFKYFHDWRNGCHEFDHSGNDCCWSGKQFVSQLCEAVGSTLEELALSYKSPAPVDDDSALLIPLLDYSGFNRLKSLVILEDLWTESSAITAGLSHVLSFNDPLTVIPVRMEHEQCVPALFDILPPNIETVAIDVPKDAQLRVLVRLLFDPETKQGLQCPRISSIRIGGSHVTLEDLSSIFGDMPFKAKLRLQTEKLGEALARQWDDEVTALQ